MFSESLGGESIRHQVGNGSQAPFVNQYVVSILLVYTAGERRPLFGLLLRRLLFLLGIGLSNGSSSRGGKDGGKNRE